MAGHVPCSGVTDIHHAPQNTRKAWKAPSVSMARTVPLDKPSIQVIYDFTGGDRLTNDEVAREKVGTAAATGRVSDCLRRQRDDGRRVT